MWLHPPWFLPAAYLGRRNALSSILDLNTSSCSIKTNHAKESFSQLVLSFFLPLFYLIVASSPCSPSHVAYSFLYDSRSRRRRRQRHLSCLRRRVHLPQSCSYNHAPASDFPKTPRRSPLNGRAQSQICFDDSDVPNLFFLWPVRPLPACLSPNISQCLCSYTSSSYAPTTAETDSKTISQDKTHCPTGASRQTAGPARVIVLRRKFSRRAKAPLSAAAATPGDVTATIAPKTTTACWKIVQASRRDDIRLRNRRIRQQAILILTAKETRATAQIFFVGPRTNCVPELDNDYCYKYNNYSWLQRQETPTQSQIQIQIQIPHISNEPETLLILLCPQQGPSNFQVARTRRGRFGEQEISGQETSDPPEQR